MDRPRQQVVGVLILDLYCTRIENMGIKGEDTVKGNPRNTDLGQNERRHHQRSY